VHARLVVGARLAQRLVLNAIKVRSASEQREELVLERIAEDLAEVPDGRDVGIARENLLDRKGVVGVDEKGRLLRLAPAFEFLLRYLRERAEVALQRRAILRQPGIAHLRSLAALEQHDVLFQERRPRRMRMVEALRRGAAHG